MKIMSNLFSAVDSADEATVHTVRMRLEDLEAEMRSIAPCDFRVHHCAVCLCRSGTGLDPNCDASSVKLSSDAQHYLVIDTNVVLHQVIPPDSKCSFMSLSQESFTTKLQSLQSLRACAI